MCRWERSRVKGVWITTGWALIGVYKKILFLQSLFGKIQINIWKNLFKPIDYMTQNTKIRLVIVCTPVSIAKNNNFLPMLQCYISSAKY